MLTQMRQNWWALVLRGAAGVLFGFCAFFWPGLTLAAMVLLFGAYALVDGCFAVAAAIASAGENDRWWVPLLEGIVGIIAGLATFFLPGLTAVALVYVIAAWAIVTGALEIAAAIRLRREIEGEWLLALSGIASVLLGLLMIFRPGAGALAFVWMIGAYALLTGALLIALGFKLRGRAQPAQTRAAA